jgi:ABC-type nitrate/sulfonate/bicarbonate transport system permease component
VLREVVLSSALPELLIGIRTALAFAFVLLVASALIRLGRVFNAEERLLPIFARWLGFYDVSKISMASFNAIFSVVVATMAAADGVDRELYWPARNLGAASGSCCVRSSCRRHRRDHDPAGGTPDLGS